MKFRYIGECEKGHVLLYGLRFDKGALVEVKDDLAIRKLSANNHFEVVKSRGNKTRDSKQGPAEAGTLSE